MSIEMTAPRWTHGNATEPGVQAAIRDLVVPGQTVFDVGAHHGNVTQVLARQVGPRGLVVAFEAHPETAWILSQNCVSNHLVNAWPVQRAISARTGDVVMLIEDGAASRIGEGGLPVVTLALDDAVRWFGAPAFVKMDIEGAEAAALEGFCATLAAHRPRIVYEHNVGNDAALDILKSTGYRAFDLAMCREVHTSEDVDGGRTQENLVALHESDPACDLYQHNERMEIGRCDVSEVRSVERGGARTLRAVVEGLSGRFVAEIEATAASQSTLYIRVRMGNGLVQGQYWTFAWYFLRNQRSIVFDASDNERVEIEIGEIAQRASLKVSALKLHKIVDRGEYGRRHLKPAGLAASQPATIQ